MHTKETDLDGYGESQRARQEQETGISSSVQIQIRRPTLKVCILLLLFLGFAVIRPNNISGVVSETWS